MERHSLKGLVVAVTSSRRASELAHIIESYGGTPYIAPTLGIELGKVREALDEFLNCEQLDIVVFLTGPGTESILAAARESGVENRLLEKLRGTPSIVARSSKPRAVLCNYGIKDNVSIPSEATLEGILGHFDSELEEKKVGIFWHGSRSGEFVNALRKRGALVSEFTTYVYSQDLEPKSAMLLGSLGFKKTIPPDHARIGELIDEMILGNIDAITFTSPPAVSNFFSIAESLSKKEKVILAMAGLITVSIGPSTSLELRKNGIRVDVEPDGEYRMGKMLHELSEYVRKKTGDVAIAR